MKLENLTPEQQLEVQYVDIVAQMIYQTKLNIEVLQTGYKKLPPSSLRETSFYYCENQRQWMAKFDNALKRVKLYEMMNKDLNSTELSYYSICTSFLRMSLDLENISDLLELLKDAKDITPIMTNLKAIIQNHLNNEPKD